MSTSTLSPAFWKVLRSGCEQLGASAACVLPLALPQASA